MKKLILLSVAIFASLAIIAQQQVTLNAPASNIELISSGANGLTLQNSIQNIDFVHVKTPEGTFIKMLLNGYTPNDAFGAPELLSIKKLIEIPYNTDIRINIISYDEEIISLSDYGFLVPIIPDQPSLSKSQDPEDVAFVMDKDMYNGTSTYEPQTATVKYLSKMRGVQIARLEINPFSYDAESNTLIVKNNLVVEIQFKDADWATTNTIKEKYYSPEFDIAFNQVWNYSAPENKDAISQYPIKYVIVSDPMFEDALQDFITWKTQKGFYVIEAYTDDIGTSQANIKSYLQGLYNAGTAEDPAPSYVLFVGDVAQIPATNAGQHYTDMYTVEFDGNNDYVPEMYFGRFSATNINQLDPQIEKTLMFEQYSFPDPSYLEEVVLVAGDDNSYGPTHANGQINYAADYYFNEAHGMTSYTYLYPASGSSSSQIIANVSQGVGFVNYTAHCGSDGWAGPSFTNSDVPGLQNEDEYFFSIGNCCLSNKFDDASCFGETLLRANKKGAVAHIGGSNSTLWNEDFYWSVGVSSNINANPTYAETSTAAYDHMFHENGEVPYVDAAQIIFIGNMAVMESSSSEDQYYWEIYHVMGDPSLMPYAGIPTALAADYFSTIPIGTSELLVTTEPDAYVAISINGVLLDAKLANASGEALLEFEQLSEIADADIVATKQFRAPYIGTCMIVPNDNDYDAMLKSIISPLTIMNSNDATFEPEVEIMNLGQINLTSAIVNYVLDDDMDGSVEINWEGDLENLAFESVIFPEITLTEGTHTFVFSVTNPNNEIDQFPSNNAKTRNVLVYSGDVSLNDIVAPVVAYCNESSFTPEITITNNDPTPLTSLTCSYVCGTHNEEIVWSGNLTQDMSTTISFAELTLESGTHTIEFLIESPNNGTDIDVSDNTASMSFIINNPGIDVEMELTTDNYATEITWELVHNQTGNTIYSGGPWADGQVFNFTENWCLSDACYTFTIYDSYGDGMGGSWWSGVDPGHVTITNTATSEVYLDLDGDAYNNDAEVEFCLGTSDIATENTSSIEIYPNPTKDVFTVSSDSEILNINIYSIVGELIDSKNVSSNSFTYDAKNLAEGVYVIVTNTAESTLKQKIIITR